MCYWIIAGNYYIEPARKEGEFNREMLERLGFPLGTPSKSFLNAHFESMGEEWIIGPSEPGDKLIITNVKIHSKNTDSDIDSDDIVLPMGTNILFGPLFLSTFHAIEEDGKIVCIMTDKAKVY